ncbi:phosphotransferase [Frankia tisae]|uniref:phosphotransferase n=1 Tax=Frankia tisae TaxID=2950104 RepID=UPI0021BED9E0|nr:phosphotransferase [Frankia tisae]
MATYTTVDQIDPAVIAGHYGLREPRLISLAGGAVNSSFHLAGAGGEFVLTILDSQDAPGAARLAAHMQGVFRLGVPAPEIIPSLDGQLSIALDGRPGILKRWISGAMLDPLPHLHLPAAGRLLANIHGLPVNSPALLTLPVGTRRLSARDEAELGRFPDREFAAWLTDRLARVRDPVGRRRPTRTVIHGDFFADNLIVHHDSTLSALDWETISRDDPLLDLGIAIVGLAQDGAGLLAPARMESLLAGYQEIGTLDEPSISALPARITEAALILAYHRYRLFNITFPDPARSTMHTELFGFVDSVARHFR